MFKKRGQIWIETVIYTLIGLALIGILLSIVVPRINQMADRTLITQSINTLNKLDEQISSTLIAAGNSRQVDIIFKRGEYVIDSANNNIIFTLGDTNLKYSELGESTKQGEVNLVTIQKGSKYDVVLTLNYNSLNLTYEDKELNKTLTASPVGYKLLIENKGKLSGINQVNIRSI